MSNKEQWYDTYDILYEHFKEMQEKSKDYSDGYRAGWNDCYKMFRDLIGKKEEKSKLDPNKQYEEYKKLMEEAAKKTQNTYTYPYIPTPTPQPWHNVVRSCSVCGLQLTDSLGRPIPLGYSCNVRNCPTFPVAWSYGTESVPGTMWANSTPTYTIPLTSYKPGSYTYERGDGGSVSYTSNTIWINPRS